jgi:intracellular sulfur oxidation DsrE/DsrF family protein
MKLFFPLIVFLTSVFAVMAQPIQHRIVYDLVSADTADHAAVLRQFNNVLNAAPDAELELVCHGPAIYMFVQEKMVFEDRVKTLMQKGKVYFRVCANSMKRLGVEKQQLSSMAEIVPVAILELSEKQQKGWSYIRAGH